MALGRTPLAGILLVGGIAAIARIDTVTISHKACNSSAQLTWSDAGGTIAPTIS